MFREAASVCYRADMRSKLFPFVALLVGIHAMAIAGCGADSSSAEADAGRDDETDAAVDGSVSDSGNVRDAGGIEIDFERPSHYEPASSVEEACAQRADAMCAVMAECASYGFVLAYGDMEHCRATLSQECFASALASGSRWEVADLNACANEYAALSCGELYSATVPWAGCKSLKGGPRVAGERCNTNSQCQSNDCMKGIDECGDCLGLLGDVCNPGRGCSLGLACEYGEEGYRCRPNPVLGEECPHGGCWESSCEFGRCEAFADVGLGEPCSEPLSRCQAHLRCDEGTKTCQHPVINRAGDACGPGIDGLCTGTTHCSRESQRCVSRRRSGEPCDGATFCFRGFFCIDGICQWPKAASCE